MVTDLPATSFDGGSGATSNPYVISTAEQLRDMVKAPNASVQCAAIDALGHLGRLNNPAAVGSLIAALDDPIESIRLRAVDALSAPPAEEPTISALTRIAGHDPVDAVRRAALEALRALGQITEPVDGRVFDADTEPW